MKSADSKSNKLMFEVEGYYQQEEKPSRNNVNSYQSAPTHDATTTEVLTQSDLNIKAEACLQNKNICRPVILFVFLLSFTIFLLAKKSNVETNQSNNVNEGYIISPAVTFLNKLNLVGATYCKTSCDNACSHFDSPYGPLCCDWTATPDGESKICAQSVDKAGLCLCGAAPPSMAPPDSAPAPAPAPHTGSKPQKDDDNGFHPFPTMAWLPFKPFGDDDNSGNGGWIPFKPFKPIKIPENAVPCQKKCVHACGYSNDLCCEATKSGNCDITTVNNKCYCGTD